VELLPNPKKEKIGGKKRSTIISIDSDDDHEAEGDAAREKPLDRKGKGRALSPPAGMISLVDSDDDMNPDHELVDAAPKPPLNDMQIALDSILSIIPDAYPDYVRQLLRSDEVNGNPHVVVDRLLQGDYPRLEQPKRAGEGKGKKRPWEGDDELVKEEHWLDVEARKEPDVHYKRAACVPALLSSVRGEADLPPPQY
jgi:hypothetical protein